MHLTVALEREGAIALYESVGFERQNVRTDYYRPGRDAFAMELVIPNKSN